MKSKKEQILPLGPVPGLPPNEGPIKINLQFMCSYSISMLFINDKP